LHPDDWEDIELTKTTDGAYVFANPLGLAGPTLWGRPVIATAAQTPGEFTLGAFNLAAQIFDREDIAVEIATQNEDDFVHNIVTIRGEERLALAIHRPEAIIDGAFPQA
jgi:HK97 family phage major capsid protein